GVFAAGGHGELDMINGGDWHGIPLCWRQAGCVNSLRGFYPFAANAAGLPAGLIAAALRE
ncbi:hypothetical protein, partial [Herbaspirillum lusitanum]|uniref:hypothetical protein n=1 Tax=Herbaspirillum lusitanum TaxID=213312 RepID=UPI00058F347B